jgi:hypothetical protein
MSKKLNTIEEAIEDIKAGKSTSSKILTQYSVQYMKHIFLNNLI